MSGFGDEFDRRGDEVDERVIANDGDRQSSSDGVCEHEALQRLGARDGLSGRGEDEITFEDAGSSRWSVGDDLDNAQAHRLPGTFDEPWRQRRRAAGNAKVRGRTRLR